MVLFLYIFSNKKTAYKDGLEVPVGIAPTHKLRPQWESHPRIAVLQTAVLTTSPCGRNYLFDFFIDILRAQLKVFSEYVKLPL